MNDFDPYDVTLDQQGNPLPKDEAALKEHPKQIGRFRIEKVLGKGGFGLVYLAHDEQLDRLVAIKVPHSKLISKPEDAEAYLAEARTVANLDHAHIVPVFDVGSTDECPCYVVSKYIEGTDLSTKLKQQRLKYRDGAELVAAVAEALHYAHKQGLVHRDVKPGNILIDSEGKPHLADFGLALREENFGKGPEYAGTPSYMSPEQARGEGHRVDGRSDIFSLGVVLYELLVGRRPFRGDTQAEILEQIAKYEPRPLRQYDDSIPKELERICLFAMAKRASDRYTTAKDFADDLRFFLKEQTVVQSGASPGGVTSAASSSQPSTLQPTSAGLSVASLESTEAGSDNQPIKIIPKGLRSFDAHDADFFLELLPGPRDRNGLPDSLRFWKTRIEETDPDNTFSVGLIYGPSGCGKSSLVKAGLLPRLSDDVIPVIIEATPEETEFRMLHGLRKRCAALDESLNLKDTLATLRRGQGIPVGKKVLIVLDQFEQWLHANKEEENTDLVQALRQCDGGRVQCIVMVRDDFWMAATRFMRELEVRLVEAENSAAVDLFTIRHAEKVLSAFGRAFGSLPDKIDDIKKKQTDFLKQSIKGLAEEGKVICIRLALFAEMVKGKPWTPATLKQVGGTKGVGTTFLEETFSVSTAPPEHRYHQKAARAVLKVLLPDSGSDIKGEMQSYDGLLEVSGYARRPKNFDDLISILDSEIRLITPTDPEGIDDEQAVVQTEAGQKYYQLTHDYLVHSLRDWLTLKQKESNKGRAELALADRAAVWIARPERRQLPSLFQWLQISWHTDKKRWTEPQKKMMANTGRYHAMRVLIAAILLVAVTFGGLTIRNAVIKKQDRTYATALVDSVKSADITQVPNIIEDLEGYRELAEPLLKDQIAEATADSPEKLKLALALLPSDNSQLDYLSEQLLVCTPKEFVVLRGSLLPHKGKLTETLWEWVQYDQKPPSQRFQAAAALAKYSPKDERWQKLAPIITQHLTTVVSSVNLGSWVALLEPASSQLIDPLTAIHANRSLNDSEREAAANALSEYLRNMPDRLVDAILLADEHDEFTPLIDSLQPHAAVVKEQLLLEMQAEMPAELDKSNNDLSGEDEQLRDDHWKRQSLAAVTLVHLGFADEVWPLLEFKPNPSLRSFITHHLGKLGTDHNTLAARLELEQDDSIRRALIQSLGGLNVAVIPTADRNRISEQLKTLYANHPDSGIHSSASWALRTWGVNLPELPVGEPTLSDEQKARIDKLTAEVEDIRQRIVRAENELPIRQAAWERELAAKADSALAVPSDGLIFHFPLDESEGRETINAASEENVGVFVGPNEPDWISGVSGNGLRLDGSGQRFDCGNTFNPERSDSFSFGCWFYADMNGENGTLFSKWHYGEGKGRGFIVETRPADDKFLVMLQNQGWGNALIVESQPDLLGDHWHHLFITYDGSSNAEGLECYFDGRLTQTRTIVDSLTGTIQSDKPLQIGGRNGSNTPFTGRIDNVRIYNRQLSEKEVGELYSAGVVALVSTKSENRTPEQQQLLDIVYRPQDETLNHLKSQLTATEKLLHDAKLNGLRRWYVNGQGQTMVIIPPGADGNVDYAFAISCHEVTVTEFQRFREMHNVNRDVAPTNDCPVNNVSWYNAAA